MTAMQVVLVLFGWSAPAATLPSAATAAQDVRVICSVPQAKRTKFVRPVYPAAARQSGLAGKVVIEVVITKTGRTAHARVTKSVAPDLDQAALDAVKQWEYAPWLVNGKPQELTMAVTITFKLPRASPAAARAVGEQSPR